MRLALFILTLALVPPLHAATVSEWRHELDEIVGHLRSQHPDPFAKIGQLTFLRRVEALKGRLPDLTEEQRVAEAMRIVALVGDGHTQLDPDSNRFGLWYPVRIVEFADGVFITSAHSSVGDLAGAQIVEISGQPVERVMADVRTLRGGDNAFDLKERLHPFHNALLMKGLGYASESGELRVRVRLRSGAVVERTLTAGASGQANFGWSFRREMFGTPIGTDSDWVSAYRRLPASAFLTADPERPPHLTQGAGLVIKPLPDREAFYIQINQVGGENFASSLRSALEDVDRLKPRRLIVDIRHNPGGDGSQVQGFIHEFIERKDAPPWKELYLLTGPKTFSAAVMLVDAFLDHTTVTVIGEPPGAPLNSYGDNTNRLLPATGLRLFVSTLRHQLGKSSDLRDAIPVDIPAPLSFDDYVNGRDPAVDPILRGEDVRGIPVIALAGGGAAARRAWADRKTRFAKYSWWQAPPEIELRVACSRLLEMGRNDDALETCRLNTDIHPHVWNVWYNLGRAQRAAGLMTERLQSYRRVLEVDPNNFNRESIRGLFARELQPPVIRFGSTVQSMQKALEGSCKTMNTRRIDPPFLPDVKTEQLQIDCDGFPFLGKPRWAEFVFRDDNLEMVWIMTATDEGPATVELMTTAFGEPTHRNEKYIAFAKARTAWRHKPAEVLLYSEDLAEKMLPGFE